MVRRSIKMVINYKNLLSESLLILNTTKTLKKITVTDLQKESGISRQTFYNHFLDIDDLIQYTYKKEIVVHWDPHEMSSVSRCTAVAAKMSIMFKCSVGTSDRKSWFRTVFDIVIFVSLLRPCICT